MSSLELGLFGLALLGLYLVLSALPLFQPRPSLAERLRRFDVDACGSRIAWLAGEHRRHDVDGAGAGAGRTAGPPGP